MDQQALYLHAFNTLPQFGPARLVKLIEYFRTPEQAFGASKTEFLKAGIDKKLAEEWITHKHKLDLNFEKEKLEAESIDLLHYQDSRYPKLLLEISKFPPLLYYKGVFENIDELCVSVVGTRKITNYGRTVAPFLVEPLVHAGVTIVSGLAYGVDSQMQKLAADLRRRTIAVLGGGLDAKSFYPKEHLLLGDEIIANGGAVVSEYPPGTPPLKHHFIARNRIVSGLSVATIVVECGLKSGSLITAQYALEQNRNVYAVPGPIYSEQSMGPNNLIKMGAKLVSTPEDILEDLNLKTFPEQEAAAEILGDSPAENILLSILSFEPVTVNELITKTTLEAGQVTSALTFLEMKGKVRNLGAQQYVRSR